MRVSKTDFHLPRVTICKRYDNKPYLNTSTRKDRLSSLYLLDSSPKRCFLEQDTLTFLLSTGWFQEQIQAMY